MGSWGVLTKAMLMTKWDPTRTELAGLTQLVVTLGGQSNDGGGG